jgi:hypothetical protein
VQMHVHVATVPLARLTWHTFKHIFDWKRRWSISKRMYFPLVWWQFGGARCVLAKKWKIHVVWFSNYPGLVRVNIYDESGKQPTWDCSKHCLPEISEGMHSSLSLCGIGHFLR